jgi:hypothetical protein
VRHPAEMAEPEINAFLTHLAVKQKVSASTQNQALCALLFLYRHVIGLEVGDLGKVIRARKPTRLPVVMTRDEVKSVLMHLTGDKWLMAIRIYSMDGAWYRCLAPLIGNTRMHLLNCDGNGYSPRKTDGKTERRVNKGVTMFMKRLFSELLKRLSVKPESSNISGATRFVILLRHI